jgi:hypothetical protein
LLARLPQQGLLIFDLGFFSFVWFDAFTQAEKFFVTRLRNKTAYQVTRCLSQGVFYRMRLLSWGNTAPILVNTPYAWFLYCGAKLGIIAVAKAVRTSRQ